MIFPSNKFIQSNITKVPKFTLIQEYDLIMQKKSKLSYSQRLIIIKQVKIYLKEGKI